MTVRALAVVRLEIIAICVALIAIACKTEFPPQPAEQGLVRALGWKDTLLVADTDTFAAKLVTRDDLVIAGVPATWQSSNEAVVGLVAIPSNDETPRSPKVAQEIIAISRATGVAEISVRMEVPDLVAPATLRQTIVVRERWISISAGVNHACAVSIQRDAYCWGGGLRLLGNGSSQGSFVPARVLGGLQFQSVAAGSEHSCGITTDGLVYCWGSNPWGALGTGNTDDQLAPSPLTRGPKLNAVSAGVGFTCGIMNDLQVALCWGDNSFGQVVASDASRCGIDLRLCSRSWSVVRDTLNQDVHFTAVSAGERHSCGIRVDATVACWGDNDRALLGDSSYVSARYPRPIASALRFKKISAGAFHTCALTLTDVAYCWGTNAFGELGSNVPTEPCGDSLPCTRVPAPVATSLRFAEISVGGRSTCALTDAGEAYCWGLGDVGQLATTSTLTQCFGRSCARAPVAAAAALRFRAISVGGSHVCALSTAGGAYCWGGNVGGKLGVGTTISSALPLRIADPSR